MSGLALPPNDGGHRFPGFDVLRQSRHWDDATTEVIAARMGPPAAIRFFTEHEADTATALFNLLLDQSGETIVPVTNMVDNRLLAGETDGWHYEDMAPDGDAWRLSLQWLDDDGHNLELKTFVELSIAQQKHVIQKVQDRDSQPWHGVPGVQVWSLWTRYACTAFYSHPFAWQEIGFAGPAYPRGYKNIGVDRRESFEVKDAHPALADGWHP
jgi:Gluconate 2-dehydrogenase subunit 3